MSNSHKQKVASSPLGALKHDRCCIPQSVWFHDKGQGYQVKLDFSWWLLDDIVTADLPSWNV